MNRNGSSVSVTTTWCSGTMWARTSSDCKDESMEDMESLPAPYVLAAEIVDQLEAALEEFRGIEEALGVE